MEHVANGMTRPLRRLPFSLAGFVLVAAAGFVFSPGPFVIAAPLPGAGIPASGVGRPRAEGDFRFTTFEARSTATAEAKATATGAVLATETAGAQATRTAEIEATQTAVAPATATVGARRTAAAEEESTRKTGTAVAQTTIAAAAFATSTAVAKANATSGFRASVAAAAQATSFAAAQATEYVSLPATATAGAQATAAAEELARLGAAWRNIPRIFNPGFFILLLASVLAEVPAAFLVIRGIFDKIGIRSGKIWLAVIPINLVTVATAWFGMWLLLTNTPIPRLVAVPMMKLPEFLIEALWYRIVLRLRFREAFLLSFSANLMSYAAWVLLFGY